MSTIASQSPLNISEAVRARSLVAKDHHRKWPTGNRMVTWLMMSNSWPQYAYSPIYQKRCVCYLTTIANYYRFSLLWGSTVYSLFIRYIAFCSNVRTHRHDDSLLHTTAPVALPDHVNIWLYCSSVPPNSEFCNSHTKIDVLSTINMPFSRYL